jgi:hypothetical protein
MAVPLQRELKRAIEIDGAPYTLTISPDGLRLVEKGRRKGVELAWAALVSGDAALAAGLNASLLGAGRAAAGSTGAPAARRRR